MFCTIFNFQTRSSLFSEDKKTWEQYAQGEFLFDTMKGDHISCMNSPYIEENVKKILDL